MELGGLVRKYREALGLSQAELGRAVGVSQATIDKIESGRTTLSRFLPRIAARLGIPQRDLDPLIGAERQPGLREADTESREYGDPRRGPPDEDALFDAALRHEEASLPVYTAGEAFPIDRVKRPPPLANVVGAYGLLIKDATMEPEFWPGDTALVHPHLPPVPQSSCVFRTEAQGNSRSLLNHLVSFDIAAWRVRQWNPPPDAKREFTLARKEWPICHRVVGKYSRT